MSVRLPYAHFYGSQVYISISISIFCVLFHFLFCFFFGTDPQAELASDSESENVARAGVNSI